ncbi:MAG: hypothetical protein OQK69_13460 [Gammaproteobacteria bacterium]|nr:hypothetical protein [Gammaproteobacteria bacterium]
MIAFAFSRQAQANNETVIEISKSSRSETLGDIYSFGLHSSLTDNSGASIYAGIQFMTFDNNDINSIDSTLKIFFGQSFGKTVAPFYEIGTDLYGFLTLLDNDRQTDTCTEEHQCAIDFFFKIGLKINLGDNLILGIFHENIDFGAFHTSLSGEHRYVGSSLGIKF